jgi:hypothetical protein
MRLLAPAVVGADVAPRTEVVGVADEEHADSDAGQIYPT